jgi:hypothetical protein
MKAGIRQLNASAGVARSGAAAMAARDVMMARRMMKSLLNTR